MIGNDLAFGFDVEFLLWMLSALITAAYWGLSIGAAGQGKVRTWIRDPSESEVRFLKILPYRESLWRGFTLMRWWVPLVMSPLLVLPGALAVFVSMLDRRMTFGDSVVGALVLGIPLGFWSVVARSVVQSRGTASDESQ